MINFLFPLFQFNFIFRLINYLIMIFLLQSIIIIYLNHQFFAHIIKGFGLFNIFNHSNFIIYFPVPILMLTDFYFHLQEYLCDFIHLITVISFLQFFFIHFQFLFRNLTSFNYSYFSLFQKANHFRTLACIPEFNK